MIEIFETRTGIFVFMTTETKMFVFLRTGTEHETLIFVFFFEPEKPTITTPKLGYVYLLFIIRYKKHCINYPIILTD